MQTPEIDLDRIANDRAGVVTFGGVRHTVRPVSAVTLKLMREATPENYLDVSLAVVERCVPSISAEDRQTLIPAQIQAICRMASGDIDTVASMDPNADGPATAPASPV